MSNLNNEKKVYIAGPDVFSPDSKAIGKKYKNALKKIGMQGLYPLDNICSTSQEIVNGNFRLIDEADIVIANMNPFRGKEPDSGTAVEIGYAIAKGKNIYCYLDNDTSQKDKYGEVDENGWCYEDFGYPLNIMIAERTTIVKGTFQDVVDVLSEINKENNETKLNLDEFKTSKIKYIVQKIDVSEKLASNIFEYIFESTFENGNNDLFTKELDKLLDVFRGGMF